MKWIFILVILNYAVSVRAQAVDFSFSTSGGNYCNPQLVRFTQNCTGNPDAFTWNFGNGQGSTHGIDSANYSGPGTYTVTLIGLYRDSAIRKTKTITIYPTPSISLVTDFLSICQPGNINFTAGGSSFLASWEWNFGDGSPVQITPVNSVSHFYANFGTYTAHVKGITAFGCTDTTSTSIKVKKFDIVFAGVDPPNGCIPVNANFNVIAGIPAGDAAQSFLWDFGDGSPPVTGTAGSAGHLYTTTIPATPHVTVTSVRGCVTDYTFGTVAYGIPPLDVHAMTASGKDTFCGSEHVEFNSASTDADGYEWHFGDGNVSTTSATSTNHQYSDTGHFHIVVTALFHGCPGVKDSLDIYVKGVVASFDFSNTCSNKTNFTFVNLSHGHITHYEWNFADDPSVFDSLHYSPVHHFPVAGSFPVILSLKDSLTGCVDTMRNIVYTATPSFSSSSTSVCKDSMITYTVSNSYALESGVQYHYTIGGQDIDTADAVIHLNPPDHGVFADYVIVFLNSNHYCNDTLRLPDSTRVTGPVTDFSASPTRVCRNIPIAVHNISTPYFPSAPITTWAWDFGDGNTDTARNPPPHLYANQGGYFISLTATDNAGCALNRFINVSVDPIPEITVYPRMDTLCLGRDTATLTVYSIYQHNWTSIPGLSCYTCDTIRAYPNVTTAYVATATNLAGCSNTDTSLLKVYAPFHIAVTPANAGVCPGIPIQLRVDKRGITTWTPSVYLNDTTITNPVVIPNASTMYTVMVSDSVGCYADTSTANVHVYPLPTVDAGPDRMMPYGTAFTFSPLYSAGAASYSWIPQGDLVCTNCPRPDGTATQTLRYTLEVTDDKGCKAKDSAKIILLCDKSQLYLPSAFTPFNGGPNHYFYPLARGYKSIKTFIIYNRYGNKIFERKDFAPNIASFGWDGTIKGDNRGSTEAFVWYTEAVCEQGEVVASKGTVVLIR